MRTEASHRFERGADPEATTLATARIATLLAQIGGGSARPGLVDCHVAPRPRRSARLRPQRVDALLGVRVPSADSARILRGLGFELDAESVAVPSWRGDVSREVDLIEEVGRHYGLDRIPPTLPAARGVEGLRPWQRVERSVRDALVGAGLTEVVNYAFGPAPSDAGAAPTLRLENPLAEDQGALRASLVAPGLLQTLRLNLRQGRRDLALFELGRVFAPSPDGPREERRLGLLLSGAGSDAHWSAKRRAADFFDVKGAIELLCERLGLAAPVFEAAPDLPSFLHPGRAARVSLAAAAWGHAGALHPDVCRALELRDAPLVAELSLEPLLAAPAAPVRSRPLPRWPAASRDLSLVLPERWTAAALLAEVRAAAGPLLKDAAVADRYVGPPVPQGAVSLTLALLFQDPARTLTGDEVQAALDAVVRALKARDVEIRGA
jgi:phenylalanyl-tRNA synthetase beta chain